MVSFHLIKLNIIYAKLLNEYNNDNPYFNLEVSKAYNSVLFISNNNLSFYLIYSTKKSRVSQLIKLRIYIYENYSYNSHDNETYLIIY